MSGIVRSIVVVGTQIQLQKCGLYAHECAILNSHHICPQSWWIDANHPVDSPLYDLCPNCHYNTHAAIDGTIEGRDLSLIPPRCVKLAQQAFVIAEQNGLTPKLTL